VIAPRSATQAATVRPTVLANGVINLKVAITVTAWVCRIDEDPSLGAGIWGRSLGRNLVTTWAGKMGGKVYEFTAGVNGVQEEKNLTSIF
jgi:hypothetical protein